MIKIKPFHNLQTLCMWMEKYGVQVGSRPILIEFQNYGLCHCVCYYDRCSS